MHNVAQYFIVSKFRKTTFFFVFCVLFFLYAQVTHAATLSLSPGTGVHTAGSVFTARVVVNTQGEPINAAEGTLSFNPRELSVVSVNRSGSIFNLWVAEPTFSNAAGTISFSGGLPSGYTGSAGTIMNITFRAAGDSTAKVSFSNGSVLANDGRGTNVLSSMSGGTYTIQAASATPEPEVIVEYVPPANTPGKPNITSGTHADPTAWHSSNKAALSWNLPSDVTAVRTLINQNPTSVPTKVYENPISSITLDELPEGVSYFHLQFKNADGWGTINHYRLAVDTKSPFDLEISLSDDADLSAPVQTLHIDVSDDTSAVELFKVKINDAEPEEFSTKNSSSSITLTPLEAGYHAIIIEALDEAGNSVIGSFSFTILAFDKPVFTEYPDEINGQVIPVIKGLTRPNSTVAVSVMKIGAQATEYTLTSNAQGEFVFIPEGTFAQGVYELTAKAVDQYGAQSEASDPVRIAVQESGYVRLGGFIVSVLSVLVPLLALVFLLGFGLWYIMLYFRRFKKTVSVETAEALDILHREFGTLQKTVREHEALIAGSRKTKKLTKAETEMVLALDAALQSSQRKVEKEMQDVAKLVTKKK